MCVTSEGFWQLFSCVIAKAFTDRVEMVSTLFEGITIPKWQFNTHPGWVCLHSGCKEITKAQRTWDEPWIIVDWKQTHILHSTCPLRWGQRGEEKRGNIWSKLLKHMRQQFSVVQLPVFKKITSLQPDTFNKVRIINSCSNMLWIKYYQVLVDNKAVLIIKPCLWTVSSLDPFLNWAPSWSQDRGWDLLSGQFRTQRGDRGRSFIGRIFGWARRNNCSWFSGCKQRRKIVTNAVMYKIRLSDVFLGLQQVWIWHLHFTFHLDLLVKSATFPRCPLTCDNCNWRDLTGCTNYCITNFKDFQELMKWNEGFEETDSEACED